MRGTKGLIVLVDRCIGGEADETIYIVACLEALGIVIMACDIDAPT